MFSSLKKLFSSSSKEKHPYSLRARFDAAQTTRDNSRHWGASDTLSADEEASPEIRRILRQRSRYEVANNSYAKGLVQMLANDCIGSGPRLQMLSENDTINDFVESDFMEWTRTVHFAAKLRTMRIARCQDGEAFAVLTTNPKISGPVKLDLSVIEADRIDGAELWNPQSEESSIDGIDFDKWGNPVSYRVLKYHPGDEKFMIMEEEAMKVPAEFMLHIFRADRPGLHRGVPELTAALPLFAQLRRYNLAVLSAAEAAADFAAILYTDAPPDGESDDVEQLESIPLQRNMMLTMPAGWKMAQLDPKQPASNHAEFVKVILSEIARCVCSTYGSVAGDFSGFNYASGRLDNQIYQKSILVDRSFWETEVLDRVFIVWFREYCLQKNISAHYSPAHTWFWDGFLHVDPSKEATAQEKRLANNTTTLAAEYAKQGLDWRVELVQRAKEIKLMRELGISIAADKNIDNTNADDESPA